MKKLAAFVLALSFLFVPKLAFAAETSPADEVATIALGLRGKVQYARAYDPARLRFDCSGFTEYVFKQAGIPLGTRDDDKQALLGQKVSYAELRKGDLVFFWNSGSSSKSDVGHVGIYLGDGKYIHNANSRYDVTVSSITSSYAKEHFIAARRVITE